MVLMNLFSGQTQRTNEWTHCGMEILGRIERVAFRYTHTHTHTHTHNTVCKAGS